MKLVFKKDEDSQISVFQNIDGKEKLILRKEDFESALKEVGNKDYSQYLELQAKTIGFGFDKKGPTEFLL